jgi:hypothetical protein
VRYMFRPAIGRRIDLGVRTQLPCWVPARLVRRYVYPATLATALHTLFIWFLRNEINVIYLLTVSAIDVAGETPGLWRCPCCRALVLAQQNVTSTSCQVHSNSRVNTVSKHDGEFDAAPFHTHVFIVGRSQWLNLNSFLSAASCALAEHATSSLGPSLGPPFYPRTQALVKGSTGTGSSNGSLGCYSNCGAGGLVGRLMFVLERAFPPVAASITAFVGHTRLMRLLDPSAPAPGLRAIRYAAILLASTLAVVAAIWCLHLIMSLAGPAVCGGVDGVIQWLGKAELGEACLPMVPNGWILPIGFGILGFYIAAQLSWWYGITFRHLVLKWDEHAPFAIGFWFLICLLYTAFVYIARFLLTLAVAMSDYGSFVADSVPYGTVPNVQPPVRIPVRCPPPIDALDSLIYDCP